MGRIHEGIRTFNATVRTVLLAALCGLLGYGGFVGYSRYTKRERELATAAAQVAQLNTELKQKTEELEKLQTSLRLLKTDQRLARLDVLAIDRDADEKVVKSRLRFVELSPSGDRISDGKYIELPGDVVYIDNWVIKFDDKYVEQADLQRGTSLCLFRRIFSEQQKPTEGASLDEVGMRPQAYARGSQMSQFERRLWSDFWQIANDPAKAAEMGIRASGGLSIKPVDNPDSQGAL